MGVVALPDTPGISLSETFLQRFQHLDRWIEKNKSRLWICVYVLERACLCFCVFAPIRLF